MEVGTTILIEKTCLGCLGAQRCIGIVTDEPATHGLYDDLPGYNVSLLGGHVWRINPDAKVKVLSRPPVF